MVLIAVGSTTISYADGVIIPASVRVEAFKKQMKENGIDLYGTDDSDGTIENLGTQMKVITYKPVTSQQLELIRIYAIKNARS